MARQKYTYATECQAYSVFSYHRFIFQIYFVYSSLNKISIFSRASALFIFHTSTCTNFILARSDWVRRSQVGFGICTGERVFPMRFVKKKTRSAQDAVSSF